jgi:hypothetical protein
MTTLELMVVGIHPITIRPTIIVKSILSVPEALMIETIPKTKEENIYY